MKKENPRAHIQYRMNDTFDTGNVSLTATSYGLEIDDISTFVDVIKHSFSLSLDGTNETGKIRMTISFKSIYDDLYIGDPVQDESDGKWVTSIISTTLKTMSCSKYYTAWSKTGSMKLSNSNRLQTASANMMSGSIYVDEDENYMRMLYDHPEFDVETVYLLDCVQKKQSLNREQYKYARSD